MSAAASAITPAVQQATGSLQDVLSLDNPRALGFLALATAGGVVIAQEVADRLLPIFGFSREPSSATGFGVSAAVKFLAAIAVAGAAPILSLGALPTALAVGVAFGHAVGGAADLLNFIEMGAAGLSAPADGSDIPVGENDATQAANPALADGGQPVEDASEEADADTADADTADSADDADREPATDGGLTPMQPSPAVVDAVQSEWGTTQTGWA